MARTTKASGVLSRPLEKGSVVRLVLERIKEAMLNGELVRGDYLPSESELVRSLGVGKTSVREAIKMLEAMGIVEVRQGHGTIIREQAGNESLGPLIFQLILQQATNEDLLELRRLFEPAYTVLAMQKATDADIDGLRAQVAEFAARIKDGTQTSDDDLAFHCAVLKCTRNPFVIQIGTTIHQLFKNSISRSMLTIADVALRDHSAILEAFSARDPEALQAAVLRSFEGWRRSLDAR